MRTTVGYLLISVFMTSALIAGIYGPELLTIASDHRFIGQIQSEMVEFASTASSGGLLLAKIGLLRDFPTRVNRVALERGGHFDSNTAILHFFEEVAVLQRLRLLPEFTPNQSTSLRTDVSIYVRKDAPVENAILWHLIWQGPGISGSFYMDDQTGKIIQFSVEGPEVSVDLSEAMVYSWVGYLGLEVISPTSKLEEFNLGHSRYLMVWEDASTRIYRDNYTAGSIQIGVQDQSLLYPYYRFGYGYGFGYGVNASVEYYTAVKVKQQD